MKKLTLALLMLLGSFSLSSAEIGVNVGVSATTGVFEATAQEREGSSTATSREYSGRDTALAVLGYGSIFGEVSIGRFAVGVDWVGDTLGSETSTALRTDGTPSQVDTSEVTNTVQVDFTNFVTGYVSLNVTESMYITAGMISVDVETNESLGTGSSYGNTALNGSTMGIGYHHAFDNGMFFRASGHVMEFDSKTMASANGENLIILDELNGITGKLSIGKSF